MEAQTTAIKKHLESGRKITALDALRLYGCLRLGGRIFDLRQEGVNVKTTIINVNGKRIAEYSL